MREGERGEGALTTDGTGLADEKCFGVETTSVASVVAADVAVNVVVVVAAYVGVVAAYVGVFVA